MIANDFNDRPEHKGFSETTSAPTWKRFADAPPPDGFYWTRTRSTNTQYEIVEFEGDILLFLGIDAVEHASKTSREYYSQPILPPV